MKILYIISGYTHGGATMSFLTIAKQCAVARGHQVIIVAPTMPTESVKKELEQGHVAYYNVPMPFTIYPYTTSFFDYCKYPLRSLKWSIEYMVSYFKLQKIVAVESPDIIHTNVGPITIGHVIAHKFNIPHVWHLREYQDLDFRMKPFPSKKSFINKLKQDYIVTITDAIREHFDLLHYEKGQTIYNGIESRTNVRFISEKKNYFLCASRISEEKGFDDIIKTFSVFHQSHKDYELIILGDGQTTYLNKLNENIKKLNCEKSIRFMGYTRNVRAYMDRAKALLVASRNEGFGRMTAEACFYGCLVIGRNTGGTKEILDKTGGLTFNDNNEFYNCMIQAAEMTKSSYDQIVLQAQRKASELYTIETYTGKISDLYKKIVLDKIVLKKDIDNPM